MLSQFYLKCNSERLEIREDNVYTVCPQCGREHSVDLQDILSVPDADLYSTSVYCEDCSK